MIIAVLIKHVPDTASVLTISDDGKSLVLNGLKFVMNPYDEFAAEEAILLRERLGGEVVAVCAGPPESKETIRTALAMGVDSGLLISGTEQLAGRGLSMALAAGLATLSPDVIFAGKQAVDSDGSQISERVAELMGIPHASCITRFELKDGKAEVIREVEGGHYHLSFELPALFTTQKGINTPRYPTLPNIMKAKRATIKELSLSDLQIEPALLESELLVERLAPARRERRRQLIAGEPLAQVQKLYRSLQEEDKVL